MFHLIKLAVIIGLLGFLVVTAADTFPALGQKIEESAKGSWVEKPASIAASLLVQTGEKAAELKEKGQDMLETAHR